MGTEKEVKWGQNIPASAEQAAEEAKHVRGASRGGGCAARYVLDAGTARAVGLHLNYLSHRLELPATRLLPSLPAHPQAASGLAQSVEQAAGVLMSKAKDAAAAAARAVRASGAAAALPAAAWWSAGCQRRLCPLAGGSRSVLDQSERRMLCHAYHTRRWAWAACAPR